MNVRALFFASLKDIVGARSIEIEMAEGDTVADLSSVLLDRYPALGGRLTLVRVAVNSELANELHRLYADDEVAYLPPVSGGSGTSSDTDGGAASGRGDNFAAVVEGAISIDRVLRSVRRGDCGAVVLFIGTVRDNFQGRRVIGMEYEAHPILAEHALNEVISEVRKRWPLREIRVVHRIGRLEVGDISVAVAVSAPHRPAAFEAGRFAIDRLKETVPIWKKELLEDGEVWIEGDERVPRPPVSPCPEG